MPYPEHNLKHATLNFQIMTFHMIISKEFFSLACMKFWYIRRFSCVKQITYLVCSLRDYHDHNIRNMSAEFNN